MTSKKIVKVYPYVDEVGKLLYEVVRYEPKDFRTRLPLGNDRFKWKLDGVRKVLYRLDHIVEVFDDVIFVCEGEKDADNVAALGLHSTCCQGSAGGWQQEFGQVLRLNKVVILKHNDAGGEKYALKVIESIDGVVQDWRVIELPGLPEKGDVSDWIGWGNGRPHLMRIVSRVFDGPNPRKPAPAPIATKAPSPTTPRPATANGSDWKIERVCFADIEPEPLEWLWEPFWLDHTLNLLVGPPGVGKTFVAAHLAASVTRGSRWPDSEHKAPLGDVVYLATEDSKSKVLRPRFEAAGADLKRLHTWTVKRRAGKDGEHVEDDISLEDVDAMIHAIDDMPDLRLIIVDPVTAYIGETEPNDNKEVRRILNEVVKIAETKRLCVVLLSHLKKSQTSAINATMGAQSFVAVARVVNAMFKDPEYVKNGVRCLVPIKSNHGEDTHGKRLRIHSPDGSKAKLSVVWDAEPETRTADEIMSSLNSQQGAQGGEGRAEQTKARNQTRLLDVLDTMTKAGEGWVPVRRVREALVWSGQKMAGVLFEMVREQILETRDVDKELPNGGLESGGKSEIRRFRHNVSEN